MAANQTVTVGQTFNAFTPANVSITAGDTVTWNNVNGFHNVHLDNNSFDQPASPTGPPWTVADTFTTTGTYRYYCELHGGPNGVGMSGTVTVKPPYQAPQSASPLNVSLVPVFRQAGTPAAIPPTLRIRRRSESGRRLPPEHWRWRTSALPELARRSSR